MPSPIQDFEDELVQRLSRVLLVVGAGIACATDPSPCASWTGLLHHGLKYCCERPNSLTPASVTLIEGMIAEGTTQGYLQAASRIEDALRMLHPGEFGKWLSESVGSLRPENPRTIRALLALNTRVSTTNYDNLLEDISGLRSVSWNEPGMALRVLRGYDAGILHLHGHYAMPGSVVLSISKYEEVCADHAAQAALRSVFTLETVVFVGCGGGMNDPNFDGLLQWSLAALKACQHPHYHLCRDSDFDALAASYSGTNVRPLVYGHSFHDLAPFLERLADRVKGRVKEKTPFDTLLSAQTMYAEEKTLLSEDKGVAARENVQRAFVLARKLWIAGGRRAASHDLYSVMIDCPDDISPREQIAFCLEAASMLVQDDEFEMAMKLLEKIERHIGTLPADERSTITRFRELHRSCLAGEVELDKLFARISESRADATPDVAMKLDTESAELHFLSGNLLAAEKALGVDT